MASFSMWRELENRVFKTRFIIQKNFKNLPSLKHSLASPHRIRSYHRERVRSKRGRPDKRERKSQIREGEKEIAQARLGHATWVARPRLRQPGSYGPGRRACATQAARPRSCEPGFISLSLFFFFFFFFFSLWL